MICHLLIEQKWCLGAQIVWVNSECFAQILGILSKTQNFWVTKNSDQGSGLKHIIAHFDGLFRTSAHALIRVVPSNDVHMEPFDIQTTISARQSGKEGEISRYPGVLGDIADTTLKPHSTWQGYKAWQIILSLSSRHFFISVQLPSLY